MSLKTVLINQKHRKAEHETSILALPNAKNSCFVSGFETKLQA